MRYLLIIIICFITGAITCFGGQQIAMLRGAILSALLASALIPINNIRGKNRMVPSIISGLIGACFGIIAGISIILIECYCQQVSLSRIHDYQQGYGSLVYICALYGFLMHFFYSLRYTKRLHDILVIILVYLSCVFCNIIRMPYLLTSQHLPLIIVSSFGNCVFWALAWVLTIIQLDPFMNSGHPMSKGISFKKNAGPKIATSLIIAVVCGLGITILMNVYLSLPAWRTEIHNNHPEMINNISGNILINREILESHDIKTGKNKVIDWLDVGRWTIMVDCKGKLVATLNDNGHINIDSIPEQKLITELQGSFVGMAISPDETKIATLIEPVTQKKRYKHKTYSKRYKLKVYSINSGKLFYENDNYTFTKPELCWSQDSQSIYAVTEHEQKQYISAVSLKDNKIEWLTEGVYPQIAPETNEIYFIRNKQLYKYKKTGTDERMLDLSEYISNRGTRYKFKYTVTDDGTHIVFIKYIKNPFYRYGIFLMLAECKPDSKFHVLDRTNGDYNFSIQWLPKNHILTRKQLNNNKQGDIK